MDFAIAIRDVRFRWPGRDSFGLAIDELSIAPGQSVLLVGPSGSGKSTLLGLICGIVMPQAGSIRLINCELANMSGPARDRFRADHIGIIFQMFNLLPYLSVQDNILLPLTFAAHRCRRIEAKRRAPIDEVHRLLDQLQLDASELAHKPASTLSVGQQQRVAAARALIGAPELIIADEPTSALDRNRQTAFLDLLFREVESQGQTLLMVSHDDTLAARFDKVIDLSEIANVTVPKPPSAA